MCPLDSSVRVYGKYPVFVEEGAVVRAAVINTEGGPVYIGKDAEIMEGVLVRGPLAMCEHSVLTNGCEGVRSHDSRSLLQVRGGSEQCGADRLFQQGA